MSIASKRIPGTLNPMRGQIILLGTSHPLQCGNAPTTPSQVQTYRTYVQELCNSCKVQFVAEEMPLDALPADEKRDTIACEVARDRDIPHEYIDLTQAERASLGISDSSLANAAIHLGTSRTRNNLRDRLTRKLSDPVRERCWLARIFAKNVWPTLFICGADHIKNMHRLIRSTKQSVTVAHSDYAP